MTNKNWYDPSEPSLLSVPSKASSEESKGNEDSVKNGEINAQERWNEAVKHMSMYERLASIQNEMKVPKNLYNKHGGYYYRNAETIMNTAKPICSKYRCTLIVDDAINQIADRFYVSATALLVSWDTGTRIECTAHARETAERKGMDSSQITGAASSYARKYALNGLFLLDDVKDADTDEYAEQQKPKEEQKAEDLTELINLFNKGRQDLNSVGVDIHDEKIVDWICRTANVKSTDPGKLNTSELHRVIKAMAVLVQAKQK